MYKYCGHDETCFKHISEAQNTSPKMNHFATGVTDPYFLQLFGLFFFKKLTMDIILPITNDSITLGGLGYGKLLTQLGIWLLLAKIQVPNWRDFWSSGNIKNSKERSFDWINTRQGTVLRSSLLQLDTQIIPNCCTRISFLGSKDAVYLGWQHGGSIHAGMYIVIRWIYFLLDEQV